MFISEDERNRSCEVGLEEGRRSRYDACCEDAIPLGAEHGKAFLHRCMLPTVHPFAGAGRALFSDPREFFNRVEQIHTYNADGVAGTQDRTDIVRIMDVLQYHGQARQPPSKNIGDADLATGTRKQDVLPV
jgi:hypothetical protein